ncbi:uncharacterized protein LOC110189333 [Drosophila serrata]|uniref:uncharacterized protein LOC110189333 n=1 Tax=Drosophila serrata TaxID=7274 RepID=UPI000A1CF617|nr:uncharacterized protein LOC110189333 [Drosophila serrata]
MQIPRLLCAAIIAGILGCVLTQATDVTDSLEGYIHENQRQYDDRLKLYEDQLANFRNLFAKQLEPIDVQADSMQLKLEEAFDRLGPIAQIDSWTRQCVQNYSSGLPTVSVARKSLANCKGTIGTILSPAENTLNLLRTQYTKTLVNALASCVKYYSTNKLNYTMCVTNAISDTNRYTITNQNTFNANLKTAECSANEKIRTSWQCTFKEVYAMTSKVEVAVNLVDTCIEQRTICGSSSCLPSCSHVKFIDLAGIRDNSTIANPFKAVSANMECLEFRFY